MKFTAAFLAALLAPANAAVLRTVQDADSIEGSYIIKMKDDCSVDTLRAHANKRYTNGVWESLPGFKGFAARMSEEELAEVLASEDVDYVEKDSVVKAIGSFRNQTAVEENAVCSTTQTSDQGWGLSRTTTNTGTYEHEPAWGAGTKIYVIDTGSRCSHTDFSDACACGPSFVTGFGAGVDGCDDGNGHGTHCASTAAGQSYGIAKSAEIVGVQVLGRLGSGSTAGVISGMDWVAQQGSGSIASMSLGGGASTAMNNALDAMTTAGVFVSVAAGNCNSNACNFSPAGASTAYTVGATTQSDARATYSNYGTCVDIFAPGSSIKAAWSTSDTATNTISGTSMACPHVAGAAAAIKSENPSYSVAEIKTALSNLALKDVLPSSGFGGIGVGSPNSLLHLEC